MRPLAAAISIALVAPCLACSSVDKTGIGTRGFYSPSFDTVWDVAEKALQEEGFAPDREASSKETKTLVSRYQVSLHPFYGRGYREQATVTIHQGTKDANRWSVEVNVLREVNSEMKQPTKAVLADWEDGTRNSQKESLIARRIEMFFIPHDVSPEFRAQYGMPAPVRQPTDDPKPEKPKESDWTEHTR